MPLAGADPEAAVRMAGQPEDRMAAFADTRHALALNPGTSWRPSSARCCQPADAWQHQPGHRHRGRRRRLYSDLADLGIKVTLAVALSGEPHPGACGRLQRVG